MHSSAATGNPRSAWRWPVTAGFLALLVAGGMTVFLNSKGHKESINKRSSERFGEALERAGIRTQADPAK
jgi:hypothetical protein